MAKANHPVPNSGPAGNPNGLILSLPFIDKDRLPGQSERRFWVVKPTGDWTGDNLTGQAYGAAFCKSTD